MPLTSETQAISHGCSIRFGCFGSHVTRGRVHLKTIAKTYVDTDTLPFDARIAAYDEATDNSLTTTFLSDPLYARLKSCFLGPSHLIELQASPRKSERTLARIVHDRQDSISVQFVVRGRSLGDAAGQRVSSEPGTILLLDFAQPFVLID